MIFEILTLFPQMVDSILSESVIGRARKDGFIEVRTLDIRDFSGDRLRRVDDTPYGGGMGMLMRVQPVTEAVEAAKAELAGHSPRVIFMSPHGKPLTQTRVGELAALDSLIIVCGHYEGIDRRAVELVCDEEISIGDYIVTGGELPACILTDAVARQCEGVLAAQVCHTEESIESGLLEYPQYTRPYEYRGLTVPDVLLTGNHAKIKKWRFTAAMELTKKLRPDLLY